MVPQFLFDISQIDLGQVAHDRAAVERVNPHRGAMSLLDGIIWSNEDLTEGLAFHDVRDDEFWVPGHIPGRPIMPGVLMIESAAQLASWVTLSKLKRPFMGFAGLDQVKFRGQVVPGDRLLILAKQVEFRPRRSICDCQGLVGGNMVFEARITGMPM